MVQPFAKQQQHVLPYRYLVVKYSVAMMTVGCSGHMKTNHHLVPPLILSEMFWEACHIAFGQPFEFLIHLLPLVVGEHALHPKHDLDLHFQGQHVAKRLVLGIHQPSAVHDDNAKHESHLSAARPLNNPYSSTNHPLAPGLFFPGRKSVPMGGTPQSVLSVSSSSRDASPPISSLGELCKTRGVPSFGSFRSVQSRYSTW